MKASYDAPIRASAGALDRIMASGHPALIVFETPNCAPCQSLRPQLDDLAREFRNRVLVVRVGDVAQGWLAARYHLVFTPTLSFWRNGRELLRIAGSPGKPAIRQHIEYLLTGEVPPDPAGGPRHVLSACFAPARSEAEPQLLTNGH